MYLGKRSRDVVGQLSGVQRLEVLDLRVPLAEGRRVRVLVLLYFIDNLCHSIKFLFTLHYSRPLLRDSKGI